MTPQSKISLVSSIMGSAIVLFAIFFHVELFLSVWPYVSTDKIYQIGLTHPDVTITIGQRIAYGMSWIVVVIPSTISFYFAVKLLQKFRNGEYFSAASTLNIRNLGIALMAAMVGDSCLPSLVRISLSWNNPNGFAPLRYFYDAGDISLFFSGAAFALIGWVLNIAGQIQTENQGFV